MLIPSEVESAKLGLIKQSIQDENQFREGPKVGPNKMSSLVMLAPVMEM
jgi:hypothetical protein